MQSHKLWGTWSLELILNKPSSIVTLPTRIEFSNKINDVPKKLKTKPKGTSLKTKKDSKKT